MSMIKKILFIFILFTFLFTSKSFGEDLKKIGKYKDWETMVLAEASGKVCFAQSSPILQSPKTNKRDARLFVTFRPGEKIANEISTTAGYEFNKNNNVITNQNVEFKKNVGPLLGNFDLKEISNIEEAEFVEKLSSIYKLIKLVSNSQFTKNKTTIGFVGAPWTLLVYMINKKSPKLSLNENFFEDKFLIDKVLKILDKFLKNKIGKDNQKIKAA